MNQHLSGAGSQIAAISKKARFYERAAPGAFFLEAGDTEGLDRYLRGRNWLEKDEHLRSAELAGQGNMNYILRAITNLRTFILKQSRPWVEKYSDIAAPFDRALVEAEFYHLVADTAAADFMPRLHWVDKESRILCLEDLGTAVDCSTIYAGAPLSLEAEKQLYQFLSFLHRTPSRLSNREMRELNHFHIFVFPFEPDNNFDLDSITPGLQQLAGSIKNNHTLRRHISELGEIYLGEGGYLLHGDFFPGSWLLAESGIKVIDPEFGFAGPREFDLGVLSAHMQIAGLSSRSLAVEVHYSHRKELDSQLVRGFAGVEILRRLLGVAQLPIHSDLQRKQSLLEEAVKQVLA
jgi:5-methylthioribose kinase